MCLDNTNKTNEELTGVSENHEEVFDGDSNFTWGDVAEASEGEHLWFKGSTSSLNRRGKDVATSLSLIDENEDENEEDDEQYNDDMDLEILTIL